ncbi:unnamed protein product [Haemonchus placei]|uniref:Uncharacterized protein n=1 Tax=Haemonchus placei TaxID=6290 RepID=A0A3P7UVZ8_HAEPC|nr:unnamed protein product [Haemonchus placei]
MRRRLPRRKPNRRDLRRVLDGFVTSYVLRCLLRWSCVVILGIRRCTNVRQMCLEHFLTAVKELALVGKRRQFTRTRIDQILRCLTFNCF